VSTTIITDPLLPTLAAALDPAVIGVHVARSVGRDALIGVLQVQILKHHPGSRCTFAIAYEAETGAASVVGKVYAADRPDVYAAMTAIERAGFGPEEELSIPRPLAYVPELRLLLQEKVDGLRAKLVFSNRIAADRREASARAARWLAKFHSTAPRAAVSTGLAEQLSAVERWSSTIARLGEPFATGARLLAHQLVDAAAATRTECVCAGHGSYNCHQIILTENRTVTFDWDNHDVADPCRDVARFIVALQRLAVKYHGSIAALDGAIAVFLTTYQANSPYDVATNLAWYRALTCMQLAKYEANRSVCDFLPGIEALLDEGLRVLEENTPRAAEALGRTEATAENSRVGEQGQHG
jgi:hypothetical protein